MIPLYQPHYIRSAVGPWLEANGVDLSQIPHDAQVRVEGDVLIYERFKFVGGNQLLAMAPEYTEMVETPLSVGLPEWVHEQEETARHKISESFYEVMGDWSLKVYGHPISFKPVTKI